MKKLKDLSEMTTERLVLIERYKREIEAINKRNPIPQHILDKMRVDREKARSNEKNDSSEN